MNPFPLRRFGAALVLTLVLLLPSVPGALAGDAPASALHHGSRANAGDGTEVAYDAVYHVFLVLDRKDTFWVAPRFYHFDNGVWTASAALAGPWELVASKDVPPEAVGQRHLPNTSVTATLPSGRDAVYEPAVKAFKVAGRPGVFLIDNLYYRYDTGLWLVSKTDEGPWVVTSAKPLPPPLRRAVPVPAGGQRVELPSGATVVYDARARVFDVEGKPGMIFFDGAFYENRDEKWVSSPTGNSDFVATAVGDVPAPVRSKLRGNPPAPAAHADDATGHRELASGGSGEPNGAGAEPASGGGAEPHRGGVQAP